MSAHTQTGHFKAPPEKLFAFISNIENLPKWATAYAKSVRKEGGDYIVTTPDGDIFQTIDADNKTGIIDLHGGPTKEQMWTWPARVTSDNMGGSILAFSCIQMPHQSDAEFGMQCQALAEEFENIRKIIDS